MSGLVFGVIVVLLVEESLYSEKGKFSLVNILLISIINNLTSNSEGHVFLPLD